MCFAPKRFSKRPSPSSGEVAKSRRVPRVAWPPWHIGQRVGAMHASPLRVASGEPPLADRIEGQGRDLAACRGSRGRHVASVNPGRRSMLRPYGCPITPLTAQRRGGALPNPFNGVTASQDHHAPELVGARDAVPLLHPDRPPFVFAGAKLASPVVALVQEIRAIDDRALGVGQGCLVDRRQVGDHRSDAAREHALVRA